MLLDFLKEETYEKETNCIFVFINFIIIGIF